MGGAWCRNQRLRSAVQGNLLGKPSSVPAHSKDACGHLTGRQHYTPFCNADAAAASNRCGRQDKVGQASQPGQDAVTRPHSWLQAGAGRWHGAHPTSVEAVPTMAAPEAACAQPPFPVHIAACYQGWLHSCWEPAAISTSSAYQVSITVCPQLLSWLGREHLEVAAVLHRYIAQLACCLSHHYLPHADQLCALWAGCLHPKPFFGCLLCVDQLGAGIRGRAH